MGYSVPATILTNWKRYQKDRANQWVHDYRYPWEDSTQAYRLYTLALAKAPELGAMNRLREVHDLPLSAKWRLAAAYQMAGFSDIAYQLVTSLTTEVPEYPYRDMWLNLRLKRKG